MGYGKKENAEWGGPEAGYQTLRRGRDEDGPVYPLGRGRKGDSCRKTKGGLTTGLYQHMEHSQEKGIYGVSKKSGFDIQSRMMGK